MKISHTWVLQHWQIKLAFTCKLCAYYLVFIVLGAGALHTSGWEKESLLSLSCDLCDLQLTIGLVRYSHWCNSGMNVMTVPTPFDLFWVLKQYLCYVTQVGLKLHHINTETTGTFHLFWLVFCHFCQVIMTNNLSLFIVFFICFVLNFAVFLKHNRHTNVFLCTGTIWKMSWGWDPSHWRFQLMKIQ